MKNYKFLLSLLACGSLALLNSVTPASAETEGYVTVVRITGTATYSIDGGHQWMPLLVGKNLVAGSIVHSGDKGIVDLLVGKTYADKKVDVMQLNTSKNPAPNIVPEAEHNMVRLRPNTTLGIDKLSASPTDPGFVSDTELDCKKGHIYASVRKVSPSSEYLVKIPNGVAAVRGTQFELSSDGTSTHLGVVSGTVWLSFTIVDKDGNPVNGPDGKQFPPVQVTVGAGQSFDLDPSLLAQLSQQLSQSSSGGNGGTITQSDIDSLVTSLETLATSSEGTIDPSVILQLQTVFGSFSTIVIQVSGFSNPSGPGTDNGITPHVSSQ